MCHTIPGVYHCMPCCRPDPGPFDDIVFTGWETFLMQPNAEVNIKTDDILETIDRMVGEVTGLPEYLINGC